MKKLNDLFQELGISKVRLAKYLGVSRQMVYNYLELDDINKWPKEKKILLDRYIIGKTQVEISEELGISQAQVSRLEKSGIDNIKKLIL